ncbi:Mbeg1-like protein [Candidatus Marithrix sp. Canyon 246]|uniref:Mbeg1-like protein n=1 Tax=Candidatus Marithrix sp. Canyon 246 TaxID=1827136 RepID=UPI000849F4C0|nr:Mbeg1-like protein [Candidatus Marithrix sp. Canyon 246]
MSPAIQSCSHHKSPECQKQQQAEDCFSRIAENAIKEDKTGDSSTKKMLKVKLDQHKKDQKAARRAKAATAIYDIDINGKLAKSPSCLKLIDTNSEESLRQLESALKLPVNSLEQSYFSNEKNGYRASVFYDQRDEKYVVTFRGTNKNNLIDWKNNINNQLPDAKKEDAPSYFAAKKLGGLLKTSNPQVEYTGHSKGGGEVYEALSNSPNSVATVFNAAGPSPRINSVTKNHIAARTQNYQVGGEMLNLMQDETDPEKTIENMKWLKKQVNDGLLGTALAVKITELDNTTIAKKEVQEKRTALFFNTTDDEKKAQTKLNCIEKKYKDERKEFMNKLDKNIESREEWLKDKKAGKKVEDWVPPFSATLGERRVVGGDSTRESVSSGFTGTAALSDHKMENMNEALEDQIETDHKDIEEAVRQYDPNFDKKLKKCSSGI